MGTYNRRRILILKEEEEEEEKTERKRRKKRELVTFLNVFLDEVRFAMGTVKSLG